MSSHSGERPVRKAPDVRATEMKRFFPQVRVICDKIAPYNSFVHFCRGNSVHTKLGTHARLRALPSNTGRHRRALLAAQGSERKAYVPLSRPKASETSLTCADELCDFEGNLTRSDRPASPEYINTA